MLNDSGRGSLLYMPPQIEQLPRFSFKMPPPVGSILFNQEILSDDLVEKEFEIFTAILGICGILMILIFAAEFYRLFFTIQRTDKDQVADAHWRLEVGGFLILFGWFGWLSYEFLSSRLL